MHEREHVASPAIYGYKFKMCKYIRGIKKEKRTVLLSSALASQRLGSHRAIIHTRAEAEIIRDALDESGSECVTRAAIAEPSAASARIAISTPIEYVPVFSTLKRHE